MNKFQKMIGSLALGAVLVTSVGVSSFAQVWQRNDQWDQRRDDRHDKRDDRRDDRWDRRHDRRDDRRDDRWNDRYGNNGGYGGYGNNGYGNNSYAREQIAKGYHDGLDRGRKDAQTNRARTPNNSSHYRDGNQYYRQGFERGFFEAYNQYSNDGGRGRRW